MVKREPVDNKAPRVFSFTLREPSIFPGQYDRHRIAKALKGVSPLVEKETLGANVERLHMPLLSGGRHYPSPINRYSIPIKFTYP